MTFRLSGMLLLLCPYWPAWSQHASTFNGARAAGQGNITTTLEDEWSLLNNPAGLAGVEFPVMAGAADANFSLPSANRTAFSGAVPLAWGVAAMGAVRFGDALYSEQSLHAGVANRFGIAALGLRLSYLQYNATGFGSRGLFTLGLGGIATLTPAITFGAYLLHLNQPALSASESERLSTTMAAGVSFQASEKVSLLLEVEKDLRHAAVIKTGLHYQPLQKFMLRSGLNLSPHAVFFGTGFYPGKFCFDYAIVYHPLLGISHQLATSFQWKK